MTPIIEPRVQIRGEFCIETTPAPCGMIIFGASGDLTERKLIPSLYHLYRRKLLSKNFYVLGCARSEMTDDAFRAKLRETLAKTEKNGAATQIDDFLKLVYYSAGDYADPSFYRGLCGRLHDLDAGHATGGHHLFYLSTPPTVYLPIIERLDEATLTRECPDGRCWARVIIEKPHGRDLASARELNHRLARFLREDQIYRIDHYLGKETVQNILMFRFANSIFEPIWNRRYIDHVQITVAESLGVEHRAGYYDHSGALRDMFQNHMLQLLTLVAMEPPNSFDADRVRDEKAQLLRSIRPYDLAELDQWFVRGQYGPGQADGMSRGYRDEPGVAPDSRTETYVAAKIMIEDWRWQGVPFYLRTGKRLARKTSQIAVTFHPIPHSMFSPIRAEEMAPNMLIFNVQPDEGITLNIQAKHPGPKLCMSSLSMSFNYSEIFGEEPPEAYERLLLDCMHGDQTLYVREDAMEITWALLTPVLEAWAAEPDRDGLHEYPSGSWGPKAADELLRRDGAAWWNG